MSGMNRNFTYPTPPPIATLEVPLSSDSEDEITSLGILSCSDNSVATDELAESTSTPKARLKRPSIQDLSNDFSHAQLASLISCVSCNLKWTSTKTASQKVIHIENCAKKKFLSDETVPMLVRKEKTVDNEVSRTKKSRRPQILGTVRSLPETRSSIMGRVRAVL
ncbi:hypothetical protein BD769DRAFT_1693386, partial [Suillus cothurnatus]